MALHSSFCCKHKHLMLCNYIRQKNKNSFALCAGWYFHVVHGAISIYRTIAKCTAVWIYIRQCIFIGLPVGGIRLPVCFPWVNKSIETFIKPPFLPSATPPFAEKENVPPSIFTGHILIAFVETCSIKFRIIITSPTRID